MGYWERVPDGGLEIFYEDTHDGRWRNGQLVVERYLITCVRLIGQEVREFFSYTYHFRPRSALSTPAMPRATSDRFSRGHDPSVKSAAKKSGKKQTNESLEPSSSGTRNPIFNTERFGQHILKNPLVAQG